MDNEMATNVAQLERNNNKFYVLFFRYIQIDIDFVASVLTCKFINTSEENIKDSIRIYYVSM